MMNGDLRLLRDYARGNSQEAFATLVSRHVNLVYSVASRWEQVGRGDAQAQRSSQSSLAKQCEQHTLRRRIVVGFGAVQMGFDVE